MRYQEVRVRQKFDWTETRIEQMKALLAEGLSAAQIGAELGVSRNAIIGQVHRRGLAFVRAPRQQHKPVRPARVERRGNFRPRKFAKSKPAPPLDLPPDLPTEPITANADDLAIPFEQRRTLQALGRGDCKWPVGDPRDPDFFFCGAAREGGSSYCRNHTRRSIA